MCVTRYLKQACSELVKFSIAFTVLINAPLAASQSTEIFIPERPAELQRQLKTAIEKIPDSSIPRSQYFSSNGAPEFTNRLILEASPYLLQHAHNPVDWHPWGEAAFELARRENKPVFLSIGYSTCHWCHVMEQESFEDLDIADYLNRNFISIKVDRESQPGIDTTYMMAANLISNQSGWPLTTFLTHDAKPFFAATYFPPEQFINLLDKVLLLWNNEHQELNFQAERVTYMIQQIMQGSQESLRVSSKAIKEAQIQLLTSHDELSGGFGEAPKFPQESLNFLLIRLIEQQRTEILVDIFKTNLSAMQRGGIFDQIGGGFHRYATDQEWQVPHFEKMLYNQGLLSRIYLEGWRLTGEISFRDTAIETLNFVLREMRSPEGLFYAATDADSEGKEGQFFIWQEQEIREQLAPDEADFAVALYGITATGNYKNGNILHRPEAMNVVAERLNKPLNDLRKQREQINKKLLKIRTRREVPHLDQKIILAWNSMIITALTEAGEVLHNKTFTEAALLAAEKLWLQCRNHQGGLKRICHSKNRVDDGVQEDYAYFAQALIALYDATADSRWLDRAILITREMNKRFWDEQQSGYFITKPDPDGLPLRPRAIQDGPVPSGNSVAHEVLHKLYTRTGREHYNELSEQLILQASGYLNRHPLGMGYLLSSLLQQRQGESGALGYAARGNVTARAELQNNKIIIKLDIAEGWHINSHKTVRSNLHPTRISFAENPAAKILFPEAKKKKPAFETTPLSLFEGQNLIEIHTKKLPDRELLINIELQACKKQLCLPPEQIELSLPNLNGSF